MNATLLAPSVADAIAATMPGLRSLQLVGDYVSDDVLVGLAVLLQGREAPNDSAARAAGAAPAAPRQQPLQIERLELDAWFSFPLPEGLMPLLLGCGALRHLGFACKVKDDADVDKPGPDDAAQLGRLTQLTSLQLCPCPWEDAVLRQLLAPLTGLQELVLPHAEAQQDSGFWEHTQLGAFTHLTRLRRLALPLGALQLQGPTGGLDALASLTSLEVADLTPPQTPEWGPTGEDVPAPQLPSYPLPPQLARLKIRTSQLDAALLGCLQPPECLSRLELEAAYTRATRHDGGCRVVYMGGQFLAAPDGSLSPDGERALCSALRLLALAPKPIVGGFNGLPEERTTILRYQSRNPLDPKPLLPPAVSAAESDAAGAGPGGHGGWLRALAECGLAQLQLEGLALGLRDLEFIAQHMPQLRGLRLRACHFPGEGLPLLARLGQLELDLSPWDDLRRPPAAGAPPPDPLGGLPALRAAAPSQVLSLCVDSLGPESGEGYNLEYDEGFLPDEAEGLVRMVEEANAALAAAGLRPVSLDKREWWDSEDYYY